MKQFSNYPLTPDKVGSYFFVCVEDRVFYSVKKALNFLYLDFILHWLVLIWIRLPLP